MIVDLPATVANKAEAAGAARWIHELPALVRVLEDEWGFTIGAAYDEGTEAYVAEAVLTDGTPAVLKLLVPGRGDAARHEITVLRLADGVGCPQLFRHDAERGALLMERLGPSLHRLGRPFEQRLPIVCDTVASMWRPVGDVDLPTGAEKGRWLIDHVVSSWEELDRPCSARAVQHAVTAAERRIAAHDDERAVLVHGDAHEWNVLQAGDGWKLIDPDGLRAEREYDLGILMREDPEELMESDPWDRARWLADRTGCDATAIWEWGVVERVSTGLLATRIDLQPVGRQMLAAADRIADGP